MDPNNSRMLKSTFFHKIRKTSPEKLAKVLRVLAILTQTKVYLLWKNPKNIHVGKGN